MNQEPTWLQEKDDAQECIDKLIFLVPHHCDHLYASFISTYSQQDNDNIPNPYNALEYSNYLDQMLQYIKDNNFEKVKSVYKKHTSRTKFLGGGSSIKWDIINDITRNCSPLHMSIYGGCEKIYLWLLKEGGDISIPCNDGMTPLIIAIEANQVKMVNLLLAQPKLDVNALYKKGSALHFAVKSDKFEILKLLVTHPKIKLNLLNSELQTPLQVCQGRCRQFLLQEIQQRNDEKQQRLLTSFRSSITLGSSTERNSFTINRPKKPPIFKGYVTKLHYLKIFSYQRYLILDPESGILARFANESTSPLHPIELIALDDIDIIEISKDRWFQKHNLIYLHIVYQNNSIFFSFEARDQCQKWIESIKLCIGYTRYLKFKIEKYIFSREEKKAYKRVIQLLMEQVNQEVEIGQQCQISSLLYKSKSIQKSTYFNRQIGLKDLQVIDIIGKGAFGCVYKVKMSLFQQEGCNSNSTSKLYALKQQEKEKLQRSSNMRYAINEIQILQRLFHPFLINLQCAFQTERYLYYLMDYCDNGDLSQYMTRGTILEEETAKLIVAQLILVIEYLHENNIVYRDIKPENILIGDDNYIKLIDLGLSKQLKEDQRLAMSFCGSPTYLSPEVIKGKGYYKETDIYGIGLILYEMLTGYPPHYTVNVNELVNRIQYNTISFVHFKNKQLIFLLQKMLHPKPYKRISIKEIKEDLFFAEIDWFKLNEKELILPSLKKHHQTKSLITVTTTDHYIVDQDYSENNQNNFIQDWNYQ